MNDTKLVLLDAFDGMDVPCEGHPLDFVEVFLRRFIAYPSEHARVAHTLWIAHTHLIDCWDSTPRLAFMSPERESGKTRALEVSELLVHNPVHSINASPAYLVRKVADGGVTILFDEIDAIFGNTKAQDANVDVRSILNGGHRRGATVGRCNLQLKAEDLPSYAPVALAGLKELPDTLASRAILIPMQRRAPDEHVESFRLRKVKAKADDVRELLAKWCDGIAEQMKVAEPNMPTSIVDRAADCWEPLVAIADAAGGDWPKRARAAAVAIVTGSAEQVMTSGVQLLSNLRDIYGDAEKLFTETILDRLHHLPESAWNDIRGKPLNDRGLAMRLRRYGVKSKGLRIDGKVRNGYFAADLLELWKRYVFPIRTQGQQGQQGQHEPEALLRNSTSPTRSTEKPAENSQKSDGVGDVDLVEANGGHVEDVDLVEDVVAFEEMAGRLQYEEGLTRAEAEAQARAEMPELPEFLDRRTG